MSHTPGPWKAEVETDLDGRTYCSHVRTNAPYRIVAGGTIEVADGLLIAAVPDLLEACIAGKRYATALAQYGDKAGQIVESDQLDMLFEDWADKTDAAIRKVKGEAE